MGMKIHYILLGRIMGENEVVWESKTKKNSAISGFNYYSRHYPGVKFRLIDIRDTKVLMTNE